MVNTLNIALPVLAGLALLGAIYFLTQGLSRRTAVGRQAYGVGQQQARQDMQVSFVRAVMLLFVALILFGVYGLGFRPAGLLAADPTATATVASSPTASETAAPLDAPTNTPLPAPATLETTPTNPLLAPTATATFTPTATATPEPTTAVVNSPIVGLYLREAPGGTQEVELLPDGTVLTLLDGRETVNDLEWQQVRAPSGAEGWVAVDFIVYGTPTPTVTPPATDTPQP